MGEKPVDFKIIQEMLETISPISVQTAMALVPATQIKVLEKGAMIESAGQFIKYEFVVMSGIARKYLTNIRGDEFTADFFTGGEVITPALLRSNNFNSFANFQVISNNSAIMFFSKKEMEATMQGYKDLELFGFRVIMQEAYKNAKREKILLTASGAEKLEWFRANYPNLENEIPHYYIASFLGLTTTSLSRIRKSLAK